MGVVGGRLSENGGVRTVDQPRSGQLPQEVEAYRAKYVYFSLWSGPSVQTTSVDT